MWIKYLVCLLINLYEIYIWEFDRVVKVVDLKSTLVRGTGSIPVVPDKIYNKNIIYLQIYKITNFN